MYFTMNSGYSDAVFPESGHSFSLIMCLSCRECCLHGIHFRMSTENYCVAFAFLKHSFIADKRGMLFDWRNILISKVFAVHYNKFNIGIVNDNGFKMLMGDARTSRNVSLILQSLIC